MLVSCTPLFSSPQPRCREDALVLAPHQHYLRTLQNRIPACKTDKTCIINLLSFTVSPRHMLTYISYSKYFGVYVSVCVRRFTNIKKWKTKQTIHHSRVRTMGESFCAIWLSQKKTCNKNCTCM